MLTPAQPVLTKNGWKTASDINTGDEILTGAGVYKPLDAAENVNYDGKLYSISLDDDEHKFCANSFIVGDSYLQNKPR
jgi:intein/homing endonuclease